LIAIEWDIVEEIRRQLNQPNMRILDKAKLLNSLAYHTNALNRLLVRKEHQELEDDETAIAELIAKLPKKHRHRLMRQLKKWIQ